MKLARCISQATERERVDLAAYLAAQFEMQSLDVTTHDLTDVSPKDVAQAIQAWAFMQFKDGDDDA